ncbi:MAG: DUF547 domain-containing protein [Saprospiraceae bacterium]|nr:DUF547 domain-containing protein [Saprospiraceae bacterium]MBP7699626.1 DUF547 domain-containing protein [Saprospiraceae bacterium]
MKIFDLRLCVTIIFGFGLSNILGFSTLYCQSTPIKTSIVKPNHNLFGDLLKLYVYENGSVNYKGLQTAKHKLTIYLQELSSHPPQSAWSQNEQLAFWINAYNAFTLKLVLDNYPIKSITQLHNGNPWDVKWIKIGTQTYSLNIIEHDIIRKKFGDPRIHFALDCAAKSCPPLLNTAYTADKLQQQLSQQTAKFINHKKFNTFTTKSAKISKIFQWYANDFNNLTTFLNQYLKIPLLAETKIQYFEYDWSLNE